MPISLALTTEKSDTFLSNPEIHHHCDEISQKNKNSKQSNKQNNFVNHPCCSIFTVLPSDLIIKSNHERVVYLLDPLDKQTSFVLNLIYKPPKNDIS
jgi:hypothetical protein